GKLRGPVPTTIRSSSLGSAAALVRRSSTSSSRRPGVPVRSPSSFPSSSSALVATFVAVSNASVSTLDLDHPSVPSGVLQPHVETGRGQLLAGSLRPLHEAHRPVEVRLEITPLGR